MKATISAPHQSSLAGLEANVLAVLCYLSAAILGWIPGIRYVAWLAPLVVFFLEKKSAFVKFHAMQSFLLHLAGTLLGFLVSVIVGGVVSTTAVHGNLNAAFGFAGVAGLLTLLVGLGLLGLAVWVMLAAYRYKTVALPFIGPLTATVIDKIETKP